MTPERFQQIEELYHAALEDRRALLDADAELRHEVELLLEQGSRDPMERPALDIAANLLEDDGVAQIPVGTTLGPYIIEAPLGAGGMGEVYKARDTRLDRIVAVKVSRAEFSKRFEREARAVAALNHPNICQLHDVGPNYLVMEFIEGTPIAPTDDLPTFLDQAMQMADGLTAAHAMGITHRDLKPGNILVTRHATREGQVKILDFGLAQIASDSEAVAIDAILTSDLTDPGTPMGTVAYMSPEQARGQKVDARSDLWSLGVILYEMATRVRPFQGATTTAIFEGILSKAIVPVCEWNPKIPADLERIIARLLEKDRETRYQSAADVRADLKRVEEESSASAIVSGNLRPRGWPKYAIAAGVLLIIAGGIWWQQRAHGTPLTDQDVLVLADFANTTGDGAFDGALRQALAFELEQSPFLKIADDQTINQTLRLMARSAGQRITNDIAREVCVRAGQKATISGSIASLGRIYQIAFQATNCQSGATLAREQAEAEDKEHVLHAVAKAAAGMRAKLGESLSSIQKTDRTGSKDQVTTNSLEALKAFQLGFDLIGQGLSRAGIPHFQRAIELDPNFAAAHMYLGIAYNNTGQFALRAKSYTNAFALIDRVSERERLMISGEYYQYATGEINKAIDSLQMLVRSYPRSAAGHHLLGINYSTRGEYEKALEQHVESARSEPRNLVLQDVLAGDYVRLDRFDEAKAVLDRLFAQKVDGAVLHQRLLFIAYIQDDYRAQQKEIQWHVGKPEEFQSLNLQAFNASVHGQRRRAKELRQRAFEMARQQGAIDAQPPNYALIDAQAGDCDAASKQRLRNVLCSDALALRIAQEKAAQNPPVNPDTAELLYQRGLAALAVGEGQAAAAEFKKILDHKGRNWGLFYSPAYLGLARAASISGGIADTAKAKRAYQDFLTEWKNADKDLPWVIQATKELAELR